MEQVPEDIDQLKERIGQIEGSLDEGGELMDRLTNIDLTVSALLDRQEEAGEDLESVEGEEGAELLSDPASEPSPKPKWGSWHRCSAGIQTKR